jgi:O-antigen/teichoic acid export membrane protein
MSRDSQPDLLSRRRVSAAGAAQASARFVSALMGAGVTALIARHLSKTGFGQLSLAFTVCTIGAAVGDFGVTQIATRDMAEHPSRRATIVGALMAARLAVGTLVAVAGFLLLSLLIRTASGRIMSAAVMATIPLSAATAYSTAAQARLRSEYVGITILVQSAVWLAAVVMLSQVGAPLWAYGTAFAATSVIQAAIAAILARDLVDITFTEVATTLRALWRSAWPIGLAGLLITSYYRLDAILLYGYRGARQAAMYAAAYRMIDVLQFIPVTMSGLLLPILSRARGAMDPRTRKRAFEIAMTWMMFAAIPIALIGGVTTPRLIHLLYGHSYRHSAPLLTILLPAFASICVGYLVVAIYISEGDLRPYIAATAVGAAINVGANIALIPRYGAYAAAWSTLGTEIFVCGSLTWLLGKRHGLRLPMARILRIALAGAAGAATAWLLRHWSTGHLSLLSFGAVLTASGFVYLIAAWLAGAITAADLRVLSSRARTIDA